MTREPSASNPLSLMPLLHCHLELSLALAGGRGTRTGDAYLSLLDGGLVDLVVPGLATGGRRVTIAGRGGRRVAGSAALTVGGAIIPLTIVAGGTAVIATAGPVAVTVLTAAAIPVHATISVITVSAIVGTLVTVSTLARSVIAAVVPAVVTTAFIAVPTVVPAIVAPVGATVPIGVIATVSTKSTTAAVIEAVESATGI